MDNPYEPSLSNEPALQTAPRSWVGKLTWLCMLVSMVLLLLILVAMSLGDLGMTWFDPKGGASGNLPPVLTFGERLVRTPLPAAILLASIVGIVVCIRGLIRLFRK